MASGKRWEHSPTGREAGLGAGIAGLASNRLNVWGAEAVFVSPQDFTSLRWQEGLALRFNSFIPWKPRFRASAF